MKLSRPQFIAIITGIGFVTACLAFSTEIIRAFTGRTTATAATSPAPVPAASPATAPPQVNQSGVAPAAATNNSVTHTVHHRSGTDVMLQGEDHLIIRQTDLSGRPGSAQFPDFSIATADANYCAPFRYRVSNSTNSYVNAMLGEAGTDNVINISIGPGERYQSGEVPVGTWLFFDDERRFVTSFEVERC